MDEFQEKMREADEVWQWLVDSTRDHERRLTALESARSWRDFLEDEPETASIETDTESRNATEPASDSQLVERVERAINPGSAEWYAEARAAIREVADWLENEMFPADDCLPIYRAIERLRAQVGDE
jgi:hypothetical protein